MTGAAAALWAALVFAFYWPAFRFDPVLALSAFGNGGLPFNAGDAARAWGGAAGSAVAALAVLLALRGAGAPVAGIAGIRVSAWLGKVPLGIGMTGASVLGLGLCGLLQPSVLLAALVLLVLSGGIPRDLALMPPSAPGWAGWYTALAAAAALPGVLVPEVTYDALAYHLGAPVTYLGLHRIVRLDHMMFSDFPLAGQMAYMLGLAAGGGDICAKLLSLALGLGAIGAVARLGARLGGGGSAPPGPAAGWSAACFAATPLAGVLMAKANADLPAVLAAAAGAWWVAGSSSRAAFAAGLLFGCAAAAKLTGGYAAVAGAAAVLAVGSGPRLRRLLLLGAGAAVFLLPWLARSELLAGNPVHPFASRWLGGLGWTAANAAAYARDSTEANSFNIQYPGVLARIAAPWGMVMHDRGSPAALGPYALALVPAFLLGGAGLAARRTAVFAGAAWACWLVTARDPRFVLPAWPALCAMAGAAAAAPGTFRAVRWALVAGFAVTPLFSLQETARSLNPGPVLWGAVPRAEYPAYLLAPPRVWVPAVRAAGEAAGGGTLLVVGDVKAPFARVRAIYPSMFDTPPLEAWVRESGSAGRLAVRLRQNRVGAVFCNWGGASYLRGRFGPYSWTPRERAVLGAFWERRLDPVREYGTGADMIGAYRVLAVPSRLPRRLPLPGDAE